MKLLYPDPYRLGYSGTIRLLSWSVVYFNALITACKNALAFNRGPCSIAIRTTTRSLDGIIQIYCPSNPSHEKQSAGTPGYRRSPSFNHHNAPYPLPVLVYRTHPSGNIRCPPHTPSHRYNNPNRAQSLAVA